VIKTDAKKKTLIKYKPLGVLYHIVPFNYPFWLNFKGGIPNLLLGNSLLVRNADSTPLVGEAIQSLMNKAGFDSGEYQNVHTNY
jgi:succinate-semialdehyde dehydrogenase/glutarate-semialdehyde dehydrogenase